MKSLRIFKKGLIYPQGSAVVHNLLYRKFALSVEHLAFILQRPVWEIVWRTSLYIETDSRNPVGKLLSCLVLYFLWKFKLICSLA